MPYLIFALGILIGIYAFYRFFISAKPKDIKSFFANGIIGVFVLVLIFLAMIGRILVALALIVIALPFIIAHYKKQHNKDNNKG